MKLKSVVDGPILHSKSVVDGLILHCKAKIGAFSKIYDGIIINIPYRNVYQTNTNYICDLILFISAALLTVGFEVANGGKLLKKLNKVFDYQSFNEHLDSYSKWIRQVLSTFSLMKSSKNNWFFTCILPHEITKEFWKKYTFSKNDSHFPSEESKFTSVANMLDLSLKY